MGRYASGSFHHNNSALVASRRLSDSSSTSTSSLPCVPENEVYGANVPPASSASSLMNFFSQFFKDVIHHDLSWRKRCDRNRKGNQETQGDHRRLVEFPFGAKIILSLIFLFIVAYNGQKIYLEVYTENGTKYSPLFRVLWRRRLNHPKKKLPAALRTLLFDDGTLYTPQNQHYGDSERKNIEDSSSLCEYLTKTSRRHTEVKRIHLHLTKYSKEDHMGAKLIAESANLPLVLSGDVPVSADGIVPSMLPQEKKGWTIEKLCEACSDLLCRDHLQQAKHK